MAKDVFLPPMRNVMFTGFSSLGNVAMTIPIVYSVCLANPNISFTLPTYKKNVDLFVNKPLAIIGMDGGVLIKCSEPLGTARIFNVNGQLMKEIPNLENDAIIELPKGVYFMTTKTSNKAFKLIIK